MTPAAEGPECRRLFGTLDATLHQVVVGALRDTSIADRILAPSRPKSCAVRSARSSSCVPGRR
jgi:hypothetical protein